MALPVALHAATLASPAHSCRACQGLITPLMDLGNLYVSDFPATRDEDLPRAPLKLMRCNSCLLIQLSHTYPREKLYRRYWYRSNVNPQMVNHLRGIVERAKEMVQLQYLDQVIDIGANDGTLLSFLGVDYCRIAYEPAENLWPELQRHCMVLYPTFFPASREDHHRITGDEVGLGGKLIFSIACFYDLDSPADFVKEVKRLLHPQGLWICEMHYLPLMLETLGVDAICHEHLTYWSFTSFARLLQKYKLQIIDFETNPTNGGSGRYYITHLEGSEIPVEEGAVKRVRNAALRESNLGLDTNDPYFFFEENANAAKRALRTAILSCVISGKVIDVYGASTKGNSLLQWCGIDNHQVRQAIERDPSKWGRLTVGSWIPIVSEEQGRRKPADVWLCPIWHFKGGILEREKDFLAKGGKIIFPLPWPTVVDKEGERRLS